jgi:hypothetical protein
MEEAPLAEAVAAVRRQLAEAEGQVAERVLEVAATAESVRALHTAMLNGGDAISWLPRVHNAALRLVAEGREAELGVSDATLAQLREVRRLMQRRGYARWALMRRLKAELVGLTAVLEGREPEPLPPLPEDDEHNNEHNDDDAAKVVGEDIPTERQVAELTKETEAKRGLLEGRCDLVMVQLAALWQEMGVPLGEQEALEDEWRALELLGRLQRLNAECARQTDRATKLRPVLAMVRIPPLVVCIHRL